MSLFSSKTKSEIEKLVEENDELKNTLHTVLQKHQTLVELELKLNDTRKELSDILKQTEKHKDNLQTLSAEINSKTEKIRELTESIEALTEKDRCSKPLRWRA